MMIDDGGCGDWFGGGIEEVVDDGGDDLEMDFETFFKILGDPEDVYQFQSIVEVSPLKQPESTSDVGPYEKSQIHNGYHVSNHVPLKKTVDSRNSTTSAKNFETSFKIFGDPDNVYQFQGTGEVSPSKQSESISDVGQSDSQMQSGYQVSNGAPPQETVDSRNSTTSTTDMETIVKILGHSDNAYQFQKAGEALSLRQSELTFDLGQFENSQLQSGYQASNRAPLQETVDSRNSTTPAMDFEAFFKILGEPGYVCQSNPVCPEALPLQQSESTSDFSQSDTSQPQTGYQVPSWPSIWGTADSEDYRNYANLSSPCISEPSGAMDTGSGGSFSSSQEQDNGVVVSHESPGLMGSPANTYSASFEGWCSGLSRDYGTDMVGVSQFDISNFSTASSFTVEDAKVVLPYADNTANVIDVPESKRGFLFKHTTEPIDSQYGTQNPVMGNFDGNFRLYGESNQKSLGMLQVSEIKNHNRTKIDVSDPGSLPNKMSSADSTLCHRSDFTSEAKDHISDMQHFKLSAVKDFHHLPGNMQTFPTENRTKTDLNEDFAEFPKENAQSTSKKFWKALGANNFLLPEMPMMDSLNTVSQNIKCEDSKYTCSRMKTHCIGVKNERHDELLSSRNTVYRPVDEIGEDMCKKISYSSKDLKQLSVHGTPPSMTSQKLIACSKFEKQEIIDRSNRGFVNRTARTPIICKKTTAKDTVYRPVDMIDEDAHKKISFGGKDLKLSVYGTPSSMTSQKLISCSKVEKHDIINESNKGFVNQVVSPPMIFRRATGKFFPPQPFTSDDRKLVCIKNDKEGGEVIQPKCKDSNLSSSSPESIQSNSSDNNSQVDDFFDLRILEDISHPPRTNHSQVLAKTVATLQPPTRDETLHYNGVGSTRLKATDERLVFRVALQDLSQPKSESNPPDGVLTVPLLRHQRIALSWMVQKETLSVHCSGGILADDQGLGKTISTIALILKERSPSSKTGSNVTKKCKLETLNLDDEVSGLDDSKLEAYCAEAVPNDSNTNSLSQVKGRPAAGTLVVCPTSVLRQWAEELRNRVTAKANLSVLVYHGSNRTKDPCELATYDVVVTTYSIVSMEGPKQPLIDEEDDEKTKSEGDDSTLMGLSSSKKRKNLPCANKKGSKQKKGLESSHVESMAGPLAKVGWFRIILDEAQSIKNHRTQVARACWGLRAKRRWCLSGTPIQNAIDDLYSYFRFLRYDPYAAYNTFVLTLKNPIAKNPTKGYRKLQAVLKTIMLRRTKGTLLDGEPIINLPPRVVELKKVDFTLEERDFYTKLESDSRAQFKEFADAGTVKQNYLNILLLLLRLRQACDHPLLVKSMDSSSMWKSSAGTAKKLPQEKRISLLNCLEASAASCQICYDSPEDAVVSACGHVFCNQCICEHLTGDDKQCPASNCKVRLSMTWIFTKTTLNNLITDPITEVQSSDGSDTQMVEAVECSEISPLDSSKIKAALEVLQSLSKPCNVPLAEPLLQRSSGEDIICPENSCDTKDVSVKSVGEKAIVFSQWTRMLDLLESCLKSSSIQYRRLDGTMSIAARDKAVKDFNTLPEVPVMIMSLKAASLGLNMVAACNVLLLDLWWNPTTEDQAIDRAHRIGQTRPVKVLRLTVKDTVEDRILALQQKKREMVASAFGEDETGTCQSRLTVEDLKYLFLG